MSTIANTNLASLKGIANLSVTSRAMSDSLEKLSSGYKVNKAADDASGLAIATLMSAQIGGVRQSIINASDTINMVQTADGALQETTDLLLRMRDIAIKSANEAVFSVGQQADLQTEYSNLRAEIDTKLGRLSFNTKLILNGALTNSPTQVGPNQGNNVSITISTVDTTNLTVAGTTVSVTAGAQSSIAAIDTALNFVGRIRNNLGTIQRRLNHIINDLTIQDVNMSASKSRIMDTDFAAEISNFTKLQILEQTGTAVLAQANASPQAIIQLLG